MSHWFLELSRGWDIEFDCSELESLGDDHASLAEAWAGTSDQVRLWLCARFADTHDARLWCLGTAAACVEQVLARARSVPALDVFGDVLEPLQRADGFVLRPGLTELADAMVFTHEVPRLLLRALHLSEKIDRARDPGVVAPRARFARTLIEAYRAAQAAASNADMSRGSPFTRWGTDRVRSRHRCTPDGASIEAVR